MYGRQVITITDPGLKAKEQEKAYKSISMDRVTKVIL